MLLFSLYGCSKSSAPSDPNGSGNNSGNITIPATVVPGLGSAYHGHYYVAEVDGTIDLTPSGWFTDSVTSVQWSSDGKTAIVTFMEKFSTGFNYVTYRYESNGDISYSASDTYQPFCGPFFKPGWVRLPVQSRTTQTLTADDTVEHTTPTDSSRILVFDTISFVDVHRDTINGSALGVVSFRVNDGDYYDQNNTGIMKSGYLTYTFSFAPAIGFFTKTEYGPHFYISSGTPARGWKYVIDSYTLK
jgi:hypothetical protein